MGVIKPVVCSVVKDLLIGINAKRGGIPIPSNFLVTLVNPDGEDVQTAHITWTANAKYETEIYRDLDDAGFALLTTVALGTGEYDDELMDGDEHTVEYYARFKYDTTVLNIPTGFTVEAITGGVRLTCDAVTDADHYVWSANIAGAGHAVIATTVNPTYDHTIASGVTIQYKVRAKEGTLPVYSDYTAEEEIVLQLTDNDGNVYTSVVIGTQTWLVENLRTTKFLDGDTIPLCSIAGEYLDAYEDASKQMSWAGGNVANKAQYGALYNYYALASVKGLGISGFHIPSAVDFVTLSNYLGGDAISGGKLKEDGTTSWTSDNADNASGFTARGTGKGYYGWAGLKDYTHFWTTNNAGSYAAEVKLVTENTTILHTSQNLKIFHLAIRLIKDS